MLLFKAMARKKVLWSTVKLNIPRPSLCILTNSILSSISDVAAWNINYIHVSGNCSTMQLFSYSVNDLLLGLDSLQSNPLLVDYQLVR